jgi:large subunit ribosomal protein L25
VADEVVLIAEPRSGRGSRPAGRLRRSGRVPAVVYGLDAETVSISVPARELQHILAHGANTLIGLELGGTQQLTLVRQVQRHPTRGELLHVDFVRVRADVAVTAEVPVHLIGEAEGVRDGGLLEQQLFSLTVEARPGDIPPNLEADVSALTIGDRLTVADLALPADVTTPVDLETLVAHVAAPRGLTAEEEAAEAAAAEGEGEGEAAAPAAEDAGSEE